MKQAASPTGRAGPVRLAVIGAGLIGRRHVEHILQEPCSQLTAIVDPSPVARELAESKGVGWHPSFSAISPADRPEGAIIATPNQMHVANGLECVAARVPILVEKPLADDVATATALVEAAEAAGVPLLAGHHRRHSDQKGRRLSSSSAL